MPGREIRQSSLERAAGFTQLVKPAAPAAGAAFTRKTDGFAWERLLAVTFTYACSATVAQRAVQVLWQDGDGFTFAQAQPCPILVANDVANVFLAESSPFTTLPGPDTFATGTATSPTAGTSIATTSNLQAGRYAFTITTVATGTLAAVDVDNLKLVILGVTYADLPLSGVVGQESVWGPVSIDVPTTGAAAVQAIATATTGAIYTVTIQAVNESGTTYFNEMPDILVKSGWQVAITAAGIQAADQVSNIGLLIERINEPHASGTDDYEDYQRFMEWMQAGMPAGSG